MNITAVAHATPSLMVDLTITDLPVGTAYILVLDGYTQRRITRVDVAGTGAVAQDYTAPAGEATYLIRAFNTGDSQVDEGSATIVTPQPPSSHVWLSDPLDETSAMLVPLLVGGDRERPRHAPINVARTLGGATISSIGPQYRGVWQITIKAINPEMIRRIAAFMDTASSVLIRAGEEMFLPGRLYGALPESSESLRLYGAPPTGRWVMVVQPDDGPGIGAVISTWTWDALEAFCDAHDVTWESLGDVWPTWLDLERGPVGGGD